MKNLSVVIACAASLGLPAVIFGQGSLTPSGTPGPTMKSLDQIEARTVIDPRQPGFTLPYTISTPGSYYLAANITAPASTNAIVVTVSNVTIDLNGFSINGTSSGSNSGISVTGSFQRGIHVRNGVVRAWGGGAISASNVTGSLFEKLVLLDNVGSPGLRTGPGCTIKECVCNDGQNSGAVGIYTGDGCTLVDCTTFGVNDNGFTVGNYCTLTNCTASASGNNGIQAASYCTITNCTAGGSVSSNTTGFGIVTSDGSTVFNCTAFYNGKSGISIGSQGLVGGCTCYLNSANGIICGGDSRVVNNSCVANNQANLSTNAGIYTAGTGNTIDSNSCNSNTNGGGIVALGTHNIIIRNCAASNGYNYNITTSGNTYGAVVDSSAGGVISSTASPWTNWIH